VRAGFIPEGFDCPALRHSDQKSKRGLCKIFKWLLIIFNLLIDLLIFSYFSSLGEADGRCLKRCERLGQRSVERSECLIFAIWVGGDINSGLAAADDAAKKNKKNNQKRKFIFSYLINFDLFRLKKLGDIDATRTPTNPFALVESQWFADSA